MQVRGDTSRIRVLGGSFIVNEMNIAINVMLINIYLIYPGNWFVIITNIISGLYFTMFAPQVQ